MTFKDLTFKKKIEHIWEYYKWVILGVLFVAIAGGSLVYAMVIKPREVNYNGIAVYRSHITMEQSDGLAGDINKALGLVQPETVTVSNFYFDENDVIFNTEMEQKFITYLFSKELHIITGVKSDIEMLIDSEYIAPLNEYYSADELEEFEDKGLLLQRKDPLDKKDKAFAININNSELYNKYSIFEGYDEPVYLAVVPIAGFEDNTRAVIGEIIK